MMTFALNNAFASVQPQSLTQVSHALPHQLAHQQTASVTTPSKQITLPGTFKSLTNPGLCGDISISLGQVTDLNQLLVSESGAPVDNDNAACSSILDKNDTFSSSSVNNLCCSGGDAPCSEFKAPTDPLSSAPDSSNQIPSLSSSSSSNGCQKTREFDAVICFCYRSGGPVELGGSSTSAAQKKVMQCRGKISISTLSKTTPHVGGGGGGSTHPFSSPASRHSYRESGMNCVKQYDMMFVQSDFEPGQSFFSMTFSKTLVDNSGGCGIAVNAGNFTTRSAPLLGNDEMSTVSSSVAAGGNSADRGLMLSGHYAFLRNHDLGTVRVHLPPHVLHGEFSPRFGSQVNVLNDTQQSQMHMVDSNDRFSALSANSHHSRVISAPGLFDFTPQNHNIDFSPPIASECGSSCGTPRTRKVSLQPQSSPNHFPSQHVFDNKSTLSHSSVGYNPQSQSVPFRHQHQHQHSATASSSTSKSTRYCYGCGMIGHLHKDCPRDQLFCYNCNESGHSSKNCPQPKPWEPQQQIAQATYQQQRSKSNPLQERDEMHSLELRFSNLMDDNVSVTPSMSASEVAAHIQMAALNARSNPHSSYQNLSSSYGSSTSYPMDNNWNFSDTRYRSKAEEVNGYGSYPAQQQRGYTPTPETSPFSHSSFFHHPRLNNVTKFQSAVSVPPTPPQPLNFSRQKSRSQSSLSSRTPIVGIRHTNDHSLQERFWPEEDESSSHSLVSEGIHSNPVSLFSQSSARHSRKI